MGTSIPQGIPAFHPGKKNAFCQGNKSLIVHTDAEHSLQSEQMISHSTAGPQHTLQWDEQRGKTLDLLEIISDLTVRDTQEELCG